jgi:hypothetical protein
MIRNVTKKLAAVLMSALLISGIPLMAGCSKAKTGAETSGYVFDGTGAGHRDSGRRRNNRNTTMAPLEILRVSRPEPLRLTEHRLRTEYDFFYYLVYQNYASYVSYGYMPTTADGQFESFGCLHVFRIRGQTLG